MPVCSAPASVLSPELCRLTTWHLLLRQHLTRQSVNNGGLPPSLYGMYFSHGITLHIPGIPTSHNLLTFVELTRRKPRMQTRFRNFYQPHPPIL